MFVNQDYLKGWKSDEHKKTFNVWNKMSKNYFHYIFSSFEENKYLLKYQNKNSKFSLLDFGCSSGYLKRFLNFYYGNNCEYHGYDISKESIILARKLYGKEFFFDEDNYISDLSLRKKQYDVVYSRDTILHQKDPWKFIDQLVSKVKKKLILRLRTRNFGDTILNVENSCQLVSGEKWVPYIVLNYDELINYLKKFNFNFLITNRSQTVLGGKNNRFLDKSLYTKSAGGAETSIFASFEQQLSNKKIIETHNLEGHQYLKKNYLKTNFYKILNRLKI